MQVRAVVFDWMMTLVHYPSRAEHLRMAMRAIGRDEPHGFVDSTVDRLAEPFDDDVSALMEVLDTSAELHRQGEMLHWERCGIDSDLAEAMYVLLADPAFYVPYPDAEPVLRELRTRNVLVAVLSDIHTDLRMHADAYGWSDLVDHWVLSFEHGIEKPDHQLFLAALDGLGVAASETLMVGDNPGRDHLGVDLGMPTLLLPRRSDVGKRGLDAVLDLTSSSDQTPHLSGQMATPWPNDPRDAG